MTSIFINVEADEVPARLVIHHVGRGDVSSFSIPIEPGQMGALFDLVRRVSERDESVRAVLKMVDPAPARTIPEIIAERDHFLKEAAVARQERDALQRRIEDMTNAKPTQEHTCCPDQPPPLLMKYRSKPTECEAMQWSGDPFGGFAPMEGAHAIIRWVNANGGEARYEACENNEPDHHKCQVEPSIVVRTHEGEARAWPGFYVVMGTIQFRNNRDAGYALTPLIRDFYPCDPETFLSKWWVADETRAGQG